MWVSKDKYLGKIKLLIILKGVSKIEKNIMQ